MLDRDFTTPAESLLALPLNDLGNPHYLASLI